MKAQSVTPSLIIITHHTAHIATVCACECVWRPLDHCSLQRNRLCLDVSLSSLLWPLCDVRVHHIIVTCVCDHSSSRVNQSFSGKTQPLHRINHQLARILTWSQAHFLVQGQHISIGRDVGPIQGWGMAPFGVEWLPCVHSVQAGLYHNHTSRPIQPNNSLFHYITFTPVFNY